MKKSLFSHLLLFSTTIYMLSPSQILAQVWQTPYIEGYGEIKYFEDAAEQPDPTLEYKLLFDITSDQQKSGVNKRLWVIARTMNMLYVAGVPKEQIKIVAAFHGSATFDVVTEEAYQKKFGKSNPNLDLIKKLQKEGVLLYVCSQATAARGVANEDVVPEVIPALSALSVLSNYQIRGYALMP